jgi:hypothetical protein
MQEIGFKEPYKKAFYLKIATAEGGDYCWQIHLPAELVTPVTGACALIIARSTVTIL